MFKNNILFYLFYNISFAHIYNEVDVELDDKMAFPNPGENTFLISLLFCVFL